MIHESCFSVRTFVFFDSQKKNVMKWLADLTKRKKMNKRENLGSKNAFNLPDWETVENGTKKGWFEARGLFLTKVCSGHAADRHIY
jgi:hypothetical protein